MVPIVARVKRWWQPDSSRAERLAVFRLRCVCGEAVAGPRKSQFQVVRCGGCGKEHFVLPSSPLPSVVDSLIEVRKSSVAARPAVKPAARWRLLVLMGGVAVLLVAALYAVAYGPWLGGGAEDAARSAPSSPTGEPAPELLKSARAHLAVGNFRLALAGLREMADALGDQPNGRPGAVPRRAWEALLGQAALLADLSAESVEEILGHAAGAQPAEWATEFPVRYRGKAFVFDVEISGPPGGPYRHTWPLPRGVRLDFAEVKLLGRLPLTEPTRVLFGARLAQLRRDTPTSWEILFAPDSGVLLTDPGAAAVCCPYLGEAELQALVRRQADWLP